MSTLNWLTKGRLDKTTWSQIDTWPVNLRSFTIEIDELAPHHSWVLHHLASIHHLPFSQFDTFQVKRLVHPTALLPFPPVNASVPKVQKGHEPEAVPPLLLEAIVDGEEMKMRVLCLDWWEMGPNELDGLVKGCTGLLKLRVGITFPIVKLVSHILICFAYSVSPLLITGAIRSSDEIERYERIALTIGHDDATHLRFCVRDGRNGIYFPTALQP